VLQAHAHYHGFADYGDAENYRAELSRLRAELLKMRQEATDSKP
jgi:acyl-CoA thioesterase FadM